MAKSSNASQKPKKLPAKLAFYALQLIPRQINLSDEPMYEFNDETLQIIAYLCDIPFASFGSIEKYKTIEEKAAALFYHTIKNHSLPNGNKRTAVILTFTFLVYNEKWIYLEHKDLYDLSLQIASSSSADEEKDYNHILKLFSERIVGLSSVKWLKSSVLY